MANMKQQIKRYKNADKKNAINRAYKSALRTYIKNLRKAVEDKDLDKANELYKVVSSKLDSYVTKGIYHKNYASNQKSKLAKLINTIK